MSFSFDPAPPTMAWRLANEPVDATKQGMTRGVLHGARGQKVKRRETGGWVSRGESRWALTMSSTDQIALFLVTPRALV